MPTLKETFEFMKKAHTGQFDKAGVPYYLHPAAVHDLLPVDADEDTRHAALLHDVVEDTDTTLEDLRAMGYSEKTVRIVGLVSKDTSDGLTYQERIDALIATGDKGAMLVKKADLDHNSDPDRIAQLPPDKQTIVKRYDKAKAKLVAALDALDD